MKSGDPSPRRTPDRAQSKAAPERTALDWAWETGVVDGVLERIDLKVQRRRRRRRRIGAGAFAMALALVTGFGVVPYVRDTTALTTPPALVRSLALADGTRAELSGCTTLFADFRYSRRTVRLDRGEAFFSVAKDPRHPFLVETPAGTVRVTGTKFNVRLISPERVEVTLLEGDVTFQSTGQPDFQLSPGEQLVREGAHTGVHSPGSDSMAAATAWRSGRLALDGFTLGEVAERIAAFHGTAVSVDPAASGLRPGGSCPIGDLPAILAALEATLPIHVLAVSAESYRIVFTLRPAPGGRRNLSAKGE